MIPKNNQIEDELGYEYGDYEVLQTGNLVKEEENISRNPEIVNEIEAVNKENEILLAESKLSATSLSTIEEDRGGGTQTGQSRDFLYISSCN